MSSVASVVSFKVNKSVTWQQSSTEHGQRLGFRAQRSASRAVGGQILGFRAQGSGAAGCVIIQGEENSQLVQSSTASR